MNLNLSTQAEQRAHYAGVAARLGKPLPQPKDAAEAASAKSTPSIEDMASTAIDAIATLRKKSPALIRNMVADAFSLSPKDLITKSRYPTAVAARQIAMVLARRLTLERTSQLMAAFGGRDKSHLEAAACAYGDMVEDVLVKKGIEIVSPALRPRNGTSKVTVDQRVAGAAFVLARLSQPTIAEIKDIVAREYGIRVSVLEGLHIGPRIAEPRHVAMALASRLTGKSSATIGRAFGDRDSSTARHAIRRFAKIVTEALRKEVGNGPGIGS